MTKALRETTRLPGEGRKVHVFGVTMNIRIASMDTGGDFAIWEESCPAGLGPPRHIHHYVDEAFQILEGRYRIWCDGRTYDLDPGGVAMVPKGMPHAFRSLGPGTGRMLTTVVPGGLDDFMVEVETRGFEIPRDLQKLMEMGASHGHAFIGPPLEA
ncbi:MAG: cupin domain-containing protein [Pseudomonadota bacterium]